MNNKVLVAIDSTGLPPMVVDTLSKQMHPEQTKVLVLEIVEPLVFSVPPQMAPGYAPELAVRQKERLDRAKKVLDQAVEVLSKAGFSVDSRVAESEIKEGVLTVASEWGANLIVVTSHARKGAAKFLHPSVAQSIVRSAPCSVLVLKESVKKAAA